MTTPDVPAAAVVQTAGQAATVRVANVATASPLVIDLGGAALNPAAVGFLHGVDPLPGQPLALLGQGVEGADSSASSWLALGVPQGSPSSEIGTNYWTGGTMSTGTSGSGAAGAEAVMAGAWSGTINFTFPAGSLSKMRINGVIFQGSAFFLNGIVRIRRDGIAGTVLLRFDKGIAPNSLSASQCFEYTNYIKNDNPDPVTCTLYATAQRGAGGGAGNWLLYGDVNTPLIVSVELIGSTAANPAKAAIAVQV